MSTFTIRVALATDEESKFKELDEVMLGHGFLKTISSDAGRVYKLPEGEYGFSGDIDRRALLEKVQASAGQVGERYSVLITESKGRTWFNLETAKVNAHP